jgi:hypothetical protein
MFVFRKVKTSNMENKISSREIFVNEIRFHRSDVIHLFGFICTEGNYQPTRFVCSLTVLFSLLSQNGKAGYELIARIRRALDGPHASPLCLDVIDQFGTTQPLEAFSIQMQTPVPVEITPQLIEPIFIERIIPFPATHNLSTIKNQAA